MEDHHGVTTPEKEPEQQESQGHDHGGHEH
jgi:hypothetical protein